MDGSLSFWSLDHGDRPLSIHTIPSRPGPSNAEREPVFRLAWSAFPNLEECKALLSADTSSSKIPPFPRLVGSTLDYAGGETTLTVLGGILLSEHPGVRILQFAPLPFDPAVNPATVDPITYISELSSHINPIGLERCPTPYSVDDFILLPRSNPHFNGTHDPISILQLFKYEGLEGAHPAINATEFPPPLTPAPVHTPAYVSGGPIRPFPVELSESPYIPATFRLPAAVFSGLDTVIGAQALKVDRDDFSLIIRDWVEVGAAEEADGVSTSRRLPLRAGVAHGDTESALLSSVRV